MKTCLVFLRLVHAYTFCFVFVFLQFEIPTLRKQISRSQKKEKHFQPPVSVYAVNIFTTSSFMLQCFCGLSSKAGVD